MIKQDKQTQQACSVASCDDKLEKLLDEKKIAT
jgi:hypothetical protein